MHALTVLFTSMSLLAGLAAGQGIPQGDICCGQPIPDTNKSCTGRTAFCCDHDTNANIGSGCDKNTDFPIGRFPQGFIFPASTCQSGNSQGTVTCA
ncbi:hypothetical protein LX32DRAFT_645635 [Colletotrichum zoysiae]|uniref:Hydrophobin n=1 Tax=Colletotrichum zoysiae TaxID=1216348 RepID=A0AAD9H6J9_9PEZI|nr:hypothetical protein LX32DRAFT_645635 [Colletotrichum zoysiae]